MVRLADLSLIKTKTSMRRQHQPTTDLMSMKLTNREQNSTCRDNQSHSKRGSLKYLISASLMTKRCRVLLHEPTNKSAIQSKRSLKTLAQANIRILRRSTSQRSSILSHRPTEISLSTHIRRRSILDPDQQTIISTLTCRCAQALISSITRA